MTNVLSIVSYQFLPPKMGGQKGIALFNAALSKYVTLTCLTTKSNDPELEPGYEIENILSTSFTRYFNPFIFFTARKVIRKKKITHLIIEHPYYGWLGILLKWFCKVKLIVHSHNIEALRFKSMNKWWWGILWNYEKVTYKAANICFFITDEDRTFAINKLGIASDKCTTITYGFDLNSPPSINERKEARVLLESEYNILPDEKILFFNGTLDYQPNLDAVMAIIEKINPLLQQDQSFKYKIIICGKNLPAHLDSLYAYNDQNIFYAGFVDDITLYFKGADVFINPVIDGGGIKTKLVEALGYDLSVVSTTSGAIGVPATITNNKLKIVADSDWINFANEIISIKNTGTIPPTFFEHFYWGNIAIKAADCIKKI
ncbi:glycosyltransferase family 4 protein [Ferruginibacter sp. SUN002]|uniref:glycosyltransferase family 4 protein n=1 Tax=Ferruginibacter sp. SUN002 TaxID=2937789 RepID=UPI003D361889